jgi:hypothetical protein
VGQRLKLAISSGYVEIIEGVVRFYADKDVVTWAHHHFGAALARGSVECVKCVLRHGCPSDTTSGSYRTRSVACLKHVLVYCPEYRVDFISFATDGNLDIVDCLLAHGYQWHRTTLECCASRNQLSMIRHLFERGCREWSGVTVVAARGGYFKMLEYAHEHGAPWGVETSWEVANSADGLKCLVSAHEHGCPWDEYTLCVLAKRGAVECFQYALQSGCPCTVGVAGEIAKHSLTCLKLLREHGYAWDPEACMVQSMRYCNQDLLIYLRSEGVEWPEHALQVVTVVSSVSFLQCAYEHGLPLDSPTAPAMAALRHRLEHLKFLHEHGCPWDHLVVNASAQSGFLDCLQYALLHGCPVIPPGFTEDTLPYEDHPLFPAAREGHLDCVKCLLDHGHKLQLSPEQLEKITHKDCRKLLSGSVCEALTELLQ